MEVKIMKVLGPFEVRETAEAEPVKVWTVHFSYGKSTETESWQREGQVEVLEPITKQKVIDAIKAFMKAAEPHPLDRMEFEV